MRDYESSNDQNNQPQVSVWNCCVKHVCKIRSVKLRERLSADNLVQEGSGSACSPPSNQQREAHPIFIISENVYFLENNLQHICALK